MFDASWTAAVTVVALALTPAALSAQNPQPSESDSLRQAVARLGARLDQLEQGHCPTEPPVVLPARRPGENTVLDSVAIISPEFPYLRSVP